MGTIDYSGRLKMMKELKSHLPFDVQIDQDRFTPLSRPPKKRAPQYCQIILVFGSRDRRTDTLTQEHFFEKITIPPDHPLFTSGKSMISPVSQKIGIPLIVYLEAPLAYPLVIKNRSEYQNPLITYLLVRLKSGFADLQHQDGLGKALVARLDHKPHSIGLLTTMNAYIMMLMDKRYGNGVESDHRVQSTITYRDFAKFARKFVDDTKRSFESSYDIKL